MNNDIPRYRYYSPWRLATITIALSVIVIFLNMLNILTLYLSPPFESPHMFQELLSSKGLGYEMCIACCAVIIIVVLTYLPFFLWVYRVSSNAWAFGSKMKMSPGWAVGWFFIPLANIIKAPQALQDIWQGSRPDDFSPGKGVTVLGWSTYITGWWLCTITSFIISFYAYGFTPYPQFPNIAATLLSLAASIFMIFLIIQITAWQQDRYENSIQIR